MEAIFYHSPSPSLPRHYHIHTSGDPVHSAVHITQILADRSVRDETEDLDKLVSFVQR